jgi:hypothetical protein
MIESCNEQAAICSDAYSPQVSIWIYTTSIMGDRILDLSYSVPKVCDAFARDSVSLLSSVIQGSAGLIVGGTCVPASGSVHASSPHSLINYYYSQ